MAKPKQDAATDDTAAIQSAVSLAKHPVLAWSGADFGEALALLGEVAAGKGELAEKAGALVKRLAPK